MALEIRINHARIHTVCDFGYVALDIKNLVAEDSGEYVCRAFNALGETKSSINLNVAAKVPDSNFAVIILIIKSFLNFLSKDQF